jgi:hypothetical protein
VFSYTLPYSSTAIDDFPFVFPTKIYYALLRRCLPHASPLDVTASPISGKEYKPKNSSDNSSLHLPLVQHLAVRKHQHMSSSPSPVKKFQTSSKTKLFFLSVYR